MNQLERIKELKNKLHVQENEQMINMPNEIFQQLKVISGSKSDKKGSHIAFAYSYIYFYAYLYRYSKYYYIAPTTEDVKQLLGYSATNKTMNYLIKKNGLLEQLGLLETTTDYPVLSYFDDDKDIQFELLSQQDDEYIIKNLTKRHTNRYVIKKPIFAFERVIEGEMDNGTFYDAYNTHIIDINVFLFCMSNEELGVIAFYIYSYLKMMNDHFPCGYDSTAKRLSDEIGLGERTIKDYEKTMREYNMVELIHNMEYINANIPANERLASTHKINDFEDFTFVKGKINKLTYLNADQIEEHKRALALANQIAGIFKS